MTPDTSRRIESALKSIQQMQGVSSEAKLLAVRETIRSMLPLESYIVKAAAEQPTISTSATQSAGSQPSGTSAASSQQLQYLTDATLAFLPAATESGSVPRLGSNEPELAKLIETEVRLALNERFMASWIFKGVIAALALALTVFSFGLFQLNSQVRRADQVVQEFNKQLADSAMLIATKDAELKQRLTVAQGQLLGEVDRAKEAAQLAQRNSIAALNQELSKRVKDVDDSRDKAMARIDARANDVDNARRDAVTRIDKAAAQMVDTDVKRTTAMAVKALESERDNQLESLRAKAARIVEEMKQPTIRAVLGRAFLAMIGVAVLSAAALIIAVVALRK